MKLINLVISVKDLEKSIFEIGGVFTSFAVAEKNCFNENDVIMRIPVNYRNPTEIIRLGVYIPTLKIYVNPNGKVESYINQ